ncbi:MAG: helix-turn-helix domain-containing protein [Candidatus Schmidhempelia sp.]|nr:helix-turn-helix domain-containing protein [Candidatus Schmidhempelia sp.]
MELTEKQVIALKRKRGELDYTNTKLGQVLGISRRTLHEILQNKHYNVKPTTFKKINDWLIDQYTTIK